MKHLLLPLFLLESVQYVLSECTFPGSEFQLQGDYLLGGLFDIHQARRFVVHDRPVAVDCSSNQFTLSSYRMFQVMRFAVEEINNSTVILPNISLGYDIFDHCSDTLNFPAILNLVSVNGSIRLQGNANDFVPRVIGIIGPFGSTETLTVAPLFMTNLIPMEEIEPILRESGDNISDTQVNYGSASSALSEKQKYPSFLRTVPSNKDIIRLIVHIMQYFDWRWVAFLKDDDAYSKDGLELFKSTIKDTEICLAYTHELNSDSDFLQIFKDIDDQKISVVVVFTMKRHAEAVIQSAIQLNVSKKVWIAGDSWSLNKKLPKEKGIEKIGTILGVTETLVPLPGFPEFIYSSKERRKCANAGQEIFCNQVCDCSSVHPDSIVAENPSYSFPIYSAIYAVAYALHNVLQCRADKCCDNITVYPYMVLAELRKSNFTLLNYTIQFDKNGDHKYASYAIVFWNHTGDAEMVGSYETQQLVPFFINSTKIQWYTNGTVPVSVCSQECPVGYVRKQDGIHECCFRCQICGNGTYANKTENAYQCIDCEDSEWSEEGSTSCSQRSVEFVPVTDPLSVVIMLGTCAMVALSLTLAILFAFNYNTPVVKSAGGPMCFLILGCLCLCSLSVFFYFGKPTDAGCILRYLPFVLFYTPCIACFVVRSFQIVCIFKMAAKFPKLHGWWMKYNGQWIVITVAFVTQAFLLIVVYAADAPHPYNDTMYYDKIILSCNSSNIGVFSVSIALLGALCFLCFTFSYMGKDLPKNYNEAKAITFCLLLLILTWIIFTTEAVLYHGKHVQTLNALAVLSSVYCFLLWYFLPKCYIIVFQPRKNTPQYFQGLIQSYTKNISK